MSNTEIQPSGNQNIKHQFTLTNSPYFTLTDSLLLLTVILLSCLIYTLKIQTIPLLQNQNNPTKKYNWYIPTESEKKIKECMRRIRDTTNFNRISLYFINEPKIENNEVKAETYRLYIEASSSIPMRKDARLSFGYINEELNQIIQEKVQYKYYKKATDGLVCQVWLRDRSTTSYLFYMVHNFCFLLLEKTSNINPIIKLFSPKKDGNYIQLCDSISNNVPPIS